MIPEDLTIFTPAFLIQTAASGVAILVLTGIAAWARLSRPTPPLDEAAARRMLADEFPGKPLDRIWISDDARSAIARSDGLALVLYAVGDGYVARHLAWDHAVQAPNDNGRVDLRLDDFAAPRAHIAFATWPPN